MKHTRYPILNTTNTMTQHAQAGPLIWEYYRIIIRVSQGHKTPTSKHTTTQFKSFSCFIPLSSRLTGIQS